MRLYLNTNSESTRQNNKCIHTNTENLLPQLLVELVLVGEPGAGGGSHVQVSRDTVGKLKAQSLKYSTLHNPFPSGSQSNTCRFSVEKQKETQEEFRVQWRLVKAPLGSRSVPALRPRFSRVTGTSRPAAVFVSN